MPVTSSLSKAIQVVLLMSFAVAASATSPTAGEAALLTNLVAAAAAKDPGVDVLTRDDVRAVAAVDADRQNLSCDTSACLADLAGAMGAGVVAYGSVGRLGDELLLSLSLFDNAAGASAGRVVLRANDVAGLSTQIEPAITGLIGTFRERTTRPPEGERLKLLVLDLEVTDGTATPNPAPAPGPPVLALVGGGVAVVGLAVLGAGGFFDWSAVDLDRRARAPGVAQSEAADLFLQRDNAAGLAGTLYVVGGAVAVVGVGLAVAGFIVE